jgi:hypothetical protein
MCGFSANCKSTSYVHSLLKGLQCRDEFLAMGILHMTNAVSFLNNDCKLVSVSGPGIVDRLALWTHGFDGPALPATYKLLRH